MRIVAAMLLLGILAPTYAWSQESLRCGSKIVRTGMTQDEVRKYCGKPSATSIEEHDVRAGNRVVGKTQVHIWTYNRASGQNAAVLHFDQDKLMSITYVRK